MQVGQPGPPKKDEQQVIEVQEQLMETYQEQSIKNLYFETQNSSKHLKETFRFEVEKRSQILTNDRHGSQNGSGL